MSNDPGFDVAGAAAPTGNENVTPSTEGGDSHNPAWNPVFEKLPTEFHNMIAPTLREWDSNFQKVQSQYAPYKQFAEQQIPAEDIQTAMQVANLLQTNPRFVFDKMMEQYGEEWGISGGQGLAEAEEFEEQEPGEGPEFDLERDPRFQHLQQQQEAIVQFQQAQMEQQARQQIDQEINRDFATVEQKHGKLSQDDVNMIVSVAVSQNMSVPQAADKVFSYRGVQQQQAQQNNSLPNVVPPGGGMPSQAVNPANLDGKATRDLVAGILRNANQQT